VIGAKARFDPEKCQKEIFAPLPAILFIRRVSGGLAGMLTKLSRMGDPFVFNLVRLCPDVSSSVMDNSSRSVGDDRYPFYFFLVITPLSFRIDS